MRLDGLVAQPSNAFAASLIFGRLSTRHGSFVRSEKNTDVAQPEGDGGVCATAVRVVGGANDRDGSFHLLSFRRLLFGLPLQRSQRGSHRGDRFLPHVAEVDVVGPHPVPTKRLAMQVDQLDFFLSHDRHAPLLLVCSTADLREQR